MTTLKLFTLPPSPYNTKVRLALKYKGLAFESIAVNPENRDAVIAASGQPLTPVLLDGDKAIYDSFAILRYLDANFPGPRLYSGTKEGQREIQSWEQYGFGISPIMGMIGGQFFSGTIDDNATAKAQEMFNAVPQKLEDALANQDYLMGSEPNAADFSLVPFFGFAVMNAADAPEGLIRFVVERLSLSPNFPKVRAWVDRVLAIDLQPANV